MKLFFVVLFFIVGVTYASGMWHKDTDFDYDTQLDNAESERGLTGCFAEEQECTDNKDNCCNTGDMSDAACQCYNMKYLGTNTGPPVTKCWCEHKGVWWKYSSMS